MFFGTLEGEFIALDDETGDKLWSFQTGSGIVGQPVTWEQADSPLQGSSLQAFQHLMDLPVVGLSRTLTAVARKRELQDLPKAVADLSKRKLMLQIKIYVGEVGLRNVNCR